MAKAETSCFPADIVIPAPLGDHSMNGDVRNGEGKQFWANCALLWELLCELREENA